MGLGTHQQNTEPSVFPVLREIPLERICRIFEVDPSLMRPTSDLAETQWEYYARFFESFRDYVSRELERTSILGADSVKDEPRTRDVYERRSDGSIMMGREILPSFDEVAESAARKWQPGRVPGFKQVGPQNRSKDKARRKLANASRKKNRK